MARRHPLALAALLLLAVLVVAPAASGDDERAPLSVRRFGVSSLTAGRSDHIRHVPPLTTPDMVSDEENPLFGAECEEPLLPLGTIDELIELIKNRVQPWFWEETEGADIRSSSERDLIVRATPAVHAEIARFLQEVDRAHGIVVTVDIQAVRLSLEEAEALRGGADPEALLYGPEAGPAVSVSTLSGNRAAVVSGLVRTWIAEADVDVAQSSKTPDPFVMAGTLGISADVRPVVGPDARLITLSLNATLSELLEDRRSPTGATGVMELPVYGIVQCQSTVRLTSGRWRLVDGGSAESGPGGWSFLVRAIAHGMLKSRTASAGFEIPALPGAVVAPMAIRYFGVQDLQVATPHIVGETFLPIPSAYTPPEPPELPEPYPLFYPEALVELIREMGPERAWEDPASIEARNGVIIARNTPPVLDGVARLLDVLRRDLVREVETRIELVEVPAAVARLVATGGTLDDRTAALLAEALASGQAVRLAGGRVTSMAGARNAALLGRVIPYVQDYEAEVAEASSILNPCIAHYMDGMTLDVRPALSTDGGSVQLALRYLRSRPTGELRTATAGAGARIELPEVEILRVGSELMIPLGRTAVAATYGQGGRRALLLLTPQYR